MGTRDVLILKDDTMAKKKVAIKKKKATKPITTKTGFTNEIYTPGAMPYANNVRKQTVAKSIVGTICVKGKALLDGNSPDEARAKIYRREQASPPATPPADAQQGIVRDFNELGFVYNYRFIRDEPFDGGNHHDVGNAKGGHSTPGSSQNWLVLWLRFDEEWRISQLQFNGLKANTTECETSVSSLK